MSSNQFLVPDDFEVGMIVTGHSSEQMNVPVPTEEGGMAIKVIQDRTYNHGLYRIKAVQLPYLALECFWHEGGPQMTGMHQADTRVYRFMRISEEYANQYPDQLKIAKMAEDIMQRRAEMLMGLQQLQPPQAPQEGATP